MSWRELRLALSLGLGLAGGLWGLVILFSDYPDGWSAARWRVYVLGSHAAFGLPIGALVPKWWFLSLVSGWGALSLGSLTLLSGSTEFLIEPLLPILATLLVAGFLGSFGVRLLSRIS